MHYTVHPPPGQVAEMNGGHVITYSRLTTAMKRAYTYLPLDAGCYVKPDVRPGVYVAVQEWDEEHEPHRQWFVSGRS